MKKIKLTKYDVAEVILDKEDVLVFLKDAIEENDPEYLLQMIDAIARSKGMTKIAKELKLDRRSLYKSLAPDGNPSFKTIFKLIDILGLQLKLIQKPVVESSQVQVEAITIAQ